MNQNKFPHGWDEERVRRVLDHYEQQTEEEAIAEDEAAYEHDDYSMVKIPNELVPRVRKLISEYQSGKLL